MHIDKYWHLKKSRTSAFWRIARGESLSVFKKSFNNSSDLRVFPWTFLSLLIKSSRPTSSTKQSFLASASIAQSRTRWLSHKRPPLQIGQITVLPSVVVAAKSFISLSRFPSLAFPPLNSLKIFFSVDTHGIQVFSKLCIFEWKKIWFTEK